MSLLRILTLALGVGLGVLSSPVTTPAGLSLTGLSPRAKTAATPASWRGKSIYQVITDRFARADQSTTAPCNLGSRTYCGGNWQGIIHQLDYIQGMGFTAIWISPVTMQLPQTTAYGEAYHGYWQQNLNQLNPKFGTVDDLQALSAAVHARNMYLMVDVVVNHFGWNGDESTFNPASFKPFDKMSYFHSYCPITSYYYSSNQSGIETVSHYRSLRQGTLADLPPSVGLATGTYVVSPFFVKIIVNDCISNVALPDLDTTNKFVISTFYSWIDKLVSDYSIDGLRIDTVKHVQKSFWPGFNSAAGVFSMGEVFDGDPAYTCPYQNVLDSVLNYPLFFSLTQAFQSSSGNMAGLVSTLSSMRSSCKDPSLLGTFIENHDNPRFPSLTHDTTLDKNVVAFTILADGIPIIYQGQEQGFSGGSDPNNREALWTASYSTNGPLYGFIASLNQIRNQEIYKAPDFVTDATSTIYSDSHYIATRKGGIVGVYTNSGAGSQNHTLKVSNTGYSAGSTVVEILSCSKVIVDGTGSITVVMSQGLPKVGLTSISERVTSLTAVGLLSFVTLAELWHLFIVVLVRKEVASG